MSILSPYVDICICQGELHLVGIVFALSNSVVSLETTQEVNSEASDIISHLKVSQWVSWKNSLLSDWAQRQVE